MKTMIIALFTLVWLTSGTTFADDALKARQIREAAGNKNIVVIGNSTLTADQLCRRHHGNYSSWSVILKKCQCSGDTQLFGTGPNAPCLQILK